MSKEDNNVDKKIIATRKEVRYEEKEITRRVPKKHWPLRTVKRLHSGRSLTPERSTDNQAVEENETLFDQKYGVISVTCCLFCV